MNVCDRVDSGLLKRAHHARRLIRGARYSEEERLSLLAAVVWPRHEQLVRMDERKVEA